jgi:chitinase
MKQLIILATSMLCFLFLIAAMAPEARRKPVIIGYVGGFRGIADVDSLNARKLSHINYAFVDIKDNRAWLQFPQP